MKTIIGKVISAKMKDTVVVEVTWSVAHPMYHKQMRRSRKFHAHNAKYAQVGNMVRLKEIRPMSKTKNWQVEEILVDPHI